MDIEDKLIESLVTFIKLQISADCVWIPNSKYFITIGVISFSLQFCEVKQPYSVHYSVYQVLDIVDRVIELLLIFIKLQNLADCVWIRNSKYFIKTGVILFSFEFCENNQPYRVHYQVYPVLDIVDSLIELLLIFIKLQFSADCVNK